MTDALTIGPGVQVTLAFALKLDDGELIDRTPVDCPATLVIGDGNLPENFENRLLGLRAGDCRTVRLAPAEAFGEHRADNVQLLDRHSFRDVDPSPGLIVSFREPGGTELPGVVRGIAGSRVEVDFNHPLAGRPVVFEFDIVAVAPAPLPA